MVGVARPISSFVVSPRATEEVAVLSNKIPQYLADAVRPSTKKTYISYWTRYSYFCRRNHLSPSHAKSIAMFLIQLAENGKSRSASLIAKHAIKYHLKLRYPFRKCSTDSYFVKRISQSIVKKFSKPVKKAGALSSADVKSLVIQLFKSNSFKDLRTAIFILVQFVLFGRFEEVSKLKTANVSLLPSGDFEFLFEQAKNYEFQDAKKSIMARNNSAGFDPADYFSVYLKKVKDLGSPWLFPNFARGKGGAIVLKDCPVSYSNMLSLLRGALDKIGLEGSKFSLHSPRVGGLSEAMNNGADRSLLARHGRWKNPEMVNYYHQMTLEKRIEASKTLSLYD